jgi:quinol monooxygenase YgiN
MVDFDRRGLIQTTVVVGAAAALGGAMPALAAGQLFVIAEVVAAPGKEKQLRDLLVPFAAKSRAEPGCKIYTLHEVAAELKDGKYPAAPAGRFVTYELFVDRAGFDAHMTSPHLAELAPKLEGLLAKPFTQLLFEQSW